MTEISWTLSCKVCIGLRPKVHENNFINLIDRDELMDTRFW